MSLLGRAAHRAHQPALHPLGLGAAQLFTLVAQQSRACIACAALSGKGRLAVRDKLLARAEAMSPISKDRVKKHIEWYMQLANP